MAKRDNGEGSISPIDSLSNPGRFGVLVGAWMQFLAVMAAVVAGGATARNYRTRS